MEAIAPRPQKRYFPGSDDERAFKKLARDPELEAVVSSDEESVNSYEDCPTVILGEESDQSDEISADSLGEDSEEESPCTTVTDSAGNSFKCIVFEAADSHSEDGFEECFFADESSDTGEASDPEGSNGGLFLVLPQKRECVRCGKGTQKFSTCAECWQEKKYKLGAPPKLKRKSSRNCVERSPIAPEDACAVCCTEPKTMTLVHGVTAHECVCYDCACRLLTAPIPKRKCPVCRKIFTSVKVNRTLADYRFVRN